MRGKARSLAPIIMGTRKLPSTAGIDGMRKKKTITIPWHGEQLVVSIGLHQVALGREEFQADEQGEESADEEEERDRHQVQSSAMRLWSVVSSHEGTPYSLFR